MLLTALDFGKILIPIWSLLFAKKENLSQSFPQPHALPTRPPNKNIGGLGSEEQVREFLVSCGPPSEAGREASSQGWAPCVSEGPRQGPLSLGAKAPDFALPSEPPWGGTSLWVP